MKRIFAASVIAAVFAPRPALAIECINCAAEQRVVVHAECGTFSPDGWTDVSPFGVAPAVLPPALRSFCLLTAPIGKSRPAISHVDDDAVVFPQTSPLAGLVWPQLRARLREATGRLPAFPPGTDPIHPVDVAIVDDAVDRVSAPGRAGEGGMEHGRTLGLIAEDLACPSGQGAGCAVALYNHRALECDGGKSGTRSALARAIYESVRAWKLREAAELEPAHLIVNLSLGFEEDEHEAATSLVVAAIQYAVCHGALVIAAAGNVRPDGTGSGPLLPAALESIATSPSCAMYADADPTGFVLSPETRPLVYAAAGVGAFGAWAPLPSTRPLGRPRLAAASFHAVAADDSNGAQIGPSAVLTGSSVASVISSAASAVVWAHLSELAPRDVADAIWESGLDLDVEPDFGIDAGDSTIHMVDVCRALRDACSASSAGECAAAAGLVCPAPPPSPPLWPAEDVENTYFLGAAINTCFSTGGGAGGPQCTIFVVPPVEEMCPVRSTSIVGPQPGELGCSVCAVNTAAGKAYLGIDSNFSGSARPFRIIFTAPNGATHDPFGALDLPMLTGGQYLQVYLSVVDSDALPIPSGSVAQLYYKTAQGEVRKTAIAWW